MNAKQKKQYMSYQEGSDLIQPKRRLGALELAFNTTDRDEIDKDCAVMFYTGDISFNFARNPILEVIQGSWLILVWLVIHLLPTTASVQHSCPSKKYMLKDSYNP